MEYIKLPLMELHRMTASFNSQCFFHEVALPLSPPETTVGVDTSSAFATSTDANRTPDKALDDQINSYWCSKKRSGTVYWGVKLAAPTTMSAEEDHNARGKLAQAVTSPMAPVMSAAFDP